MGFPHEITVNAAKEHFKIKGQGSGAVKVIHRKKKKKACSCVNRGENAVEKCAIRSLFLSWFAAITLIQVQSVIICIEIFSHTINLIVKVLEILQLDLFLVRVRRVRLSLVTSIVLSKIQRQLEDS